MRIVQKRILFFIYLSLIGLVVILCRVGYIVIFKSDVYIERAYELWTRNIPVSSQRGKIYDRNGELIIRF